MVNRERNELRAVLREKFPRSRGELLPALHYLHHSFGYLPDWAMEVVGWHLGVPSSEVYGAATSYTELRVDKPEANVVRVCTGLGCRIAGGEALLERLRAALGDMDGVTGEETPCGYLCAVAPAVEVNGKWRGRVTPESFDDILREVMS